jgi:cobalt-zinc-cadmium efflux system membrane fusion protein
LAFAAAELRAAKAKREQAETQRERARVKAPIAGTVVRVLRRAGELVDGTSATPLAELADPSAMELRADAPAADLVKLTDGMPAEVRLDALPDAPLAGQILAVSPAVDPTTSLGWVRLTFGNEPRVRLGLAGTASITLAQRGPVVTVPPSAVRRGAEGTEEVLVCDGSGKDAKAKVKAVKIGARHDDAVEIASGLAAGERVIVDHVLNLEDGAAIVIK